MIDEPFLIVQEETLIFIGKIYKVYILFVRIKCERLVNLAYDC